MYSKLLKTFNSINRFLRLENSEGFSRSNKKMLLNRIKVFSISIIIFSVYFFYMDFIQLNDLKNNSFRFFSIIIHFSGILVSFLYLVIYRSIHKKDWFINSRWSSFLIYAYIAFCLFIGALASLNTQRLTGNFDPNIIILISVAVIFPIRPLIFFFILLTTHTSFIIGLFLINSDKYTLLTKEVNTIATTAIAFLVSFSFYSFKRQDFINKLKIKDKENNFRKLFEVTPFPQILSRLEDGEIILLNKKAMDFYDLSKGEIQEKDTSIVFQSNRERMIIIEKLKTMGSVKNYICSQQMPSTRWVMINFELIDYEDEPCILSGIMDITDLKKIEDELTLHASTDSLTGIMNRRHGIEFLKNELIKAKIHNVEFILCFIDLNNLKKINDTFGHAEGDYFIVSVCQLISEIIDKDDIFFRFGGDEFIILFFHKQMHDVQKIWDSILLAFDSFHSPNHQYVISASHGLYHYKSGMDVTLEEMIHFADKEMYKEKTKLKI
ncbi:diguanylate cyclase [Ectobacillus sp. sgz5001026]|uniref:sensor domain-containing diguanylate cyclase n=1 Tax=Ectobacillus sp. sgz5001026 TaxID=3242473 RepID=UPI0036D35E52